MKLFRERTTCEIMEPTLVEVPESRLVLGRHSGRHALMKWCEDLGVSLNKEQLGVMYDRFTEAADSKDGLRNDEIAALAMEVVEQSKNAVAK